MIKQLPLVAAIATEISNQHPGSTISQDQLNIIITAANRICAAFEQPATPERNLCDNCNDWPRGGCQPGCAAYK
ncbi:hypothetical protein [Xenorhabdus cabanillasii]|uniref:Uncharacterized protein n=1 Tax=Xenorhabdus cabanillasii JM26 TaxID=1427517 RepID=W1IRE5_9GAMM|nr:hypothetical protein [Xenorhabdus cabanillasii]PHM76040.1 hypothetical protein Xcab_03422 [Xenorhabdus cabanillasii JM26]CDL80211.1 conserved hypothetical protein [Xenorhabdus cabanillasii JM26]